MIWINPTWDSFWTEYNKLKLWLLSVQPAFPSQQERLEGPGVWRRWHVPFASVSQPVIPGDRHLHTLGVCANLHRVCFTR